MPYKYSCNYLFQKSLLEVLDTGDDALGSADVVTGILDDILAEGTGKGIGELVIDESVVADPVQKPVTSAADEEANVSSIIYPLLSILIILLLIFFKKVTPKCSRFAHLAKYF